jgi:hypothetical protein
LLKGNCIPRWRPSTLKLRRLKVFARRSLREGEGWREAPGVDLAKNKKQPAKSQIFQKQLTNSGIIFPRINLTCAAHKRRQTPVPPNCFAKTPIHHFKT